jgi:hypothetical protein
MSVEAAGDADTGAEDNAELCGGLVRVIVSELVAGLGGGINEICSAALPGASPELG